MIYNLDGVGRVPKPTVLLVLESPTMPFDSLPVNVVQWNLSKADTFGAKNLSALDTCPFYRDFSIRI